MGNWNSRGLAPAVAALVAAAGAVSGPAVAQTSASYKVEEHVFNLGGRPDEGAMAGSASYEITLDALGEALPAAGLSSASYSMDGGLFASYAPPGEVLHLAFLDRQTLDWDADASAGVYQLYRDTLGTLSGAYSGSCEQQNLPASTTIDPGAPAAGDAWFYLVTVKNRLGEEGTRGVNGAGIERPDTGVCP